MPTCSAKGCFNSSKKGSSMCYFPRNLDRKKKWLDNCYKLGGMHDDWKPLESSALCEHHFIKDYWEKLREDGRKKLKCTAVPTLFGIFVKQVKKVPQEKITPRSFKNPQEQNKKSSWKKSKKFSEDLNKNTIIDKFNKTSEEQDKSVLKKYKKISQDLNKNNILEKCNEIPENQNNKILSKKRKKISVDLEQESISKTYEQLNENKNANSILEKCEEVLENHEKIISKKCKILTKNLKIDNIPEICQATSNGQNKLIISKRRKKVANDLEKSNGFKKSEKFSETLNKHSILENYEDIPVDKRKDNIAKNSEAIFEGSSKQTISKTFEQIQEHLTENFNSDIIEEIFESLDDESFSRNQEEIHEDKNENKLLKKCKQVYEDPDIAKIISQPSPEDKINYSNTLKNNKLENQVNKKEILVYNLKSNNIAKVSGSKTLIDSKLTAYDLCLKYVDQKTINKIISDNKKTPNDEENDNDSNEVDDVISNENLVQAEKSLVELQKFYKILEPGLHSEQRCGIMQKMFEKSLHLRRIIEVQYRKKEKNMRNYIKKLKNDLFLAHIKSLSNYSNLHRNQICFKNGQRKKVRQWNDKAIKYAIKLKSSCGTEGYEELLKQNFLLPSLRTLRRKCK